MGTAKCLGARTTLAAAAMLAVIFLVLVAHIESAEAAYPGANGKIVFESNRTTGTGVDNPTGDLEIFTMNKDGTGVTQLTFNTAIDISPSFSDDGSAIVFASDRVGNFEIYVMDSDGTDQGRMTFNTVFDDHPTISPNGTTIAYESERNGNLEIIVQAGIFEGNLSNNSAADYSPTFSPDGTKIAFTSDRDGGNAEVYVMDTNEATDDATN